MILTVTLNPLLERRLYFDKVNTGSDNRASAEAYTAGGKGINVSRQLKHLDLPTQALTLAGGHNGKILRRLVAEEGINMTAVPVQSETRSAALIIEQGSSQRLTTFFGPNSHITSAEAEELRVRMKKMIDTCQMVVFSGSSPSEAADELFLYGIETAHSLDRISVLDTYGNTLKNCIDAAPTVIHNNIGETERSMGISLKDEQEILSYLENLYSKGVKQIHLTNGPDEFYSSNFGFYYKTQLPGLLEADPTGSGDAFTAGIVYGLYNSLTFEESLRFASALGCANAAKWDVCRVSQDEAALYSEKISISTIGRKINTLEKY